MTRSPDARPGQQDALGSASSLLARGRVSEALLIYERLCQVTPDDPTVALAMGSTLLMTNDSDRARLHFEDMTRRFPTMEDAWQGYGKALYDGQRADTAVRAFTHAAELSTTPARALYHRGLAYLQMGNFAAGWRDYEQRLAVPAFRHRLFPRPRWTGGSIRDQRLLVICEQGYGDVFQFIRFLPLLRDLAREVIFECPAELTHLLAPALGGITVIPLRGREMPAVPFDCYVHLLSVPFCLALNPRAMAAPPAYLTAPHRESPPPSQALRIGVCWAGRATHPQDAHRSMYPEFLAPLASLPSVRLVSLQKDPGRHPPLPGLCSFLQPPDEPLDDFMATNRVMAGLDLVLSVDTSVAHLAAASGRPVWLLLSTASDWRWLAGRSDSPWYPSMRIFRQHRLGDWPSTIADVRDALISRARQYAATQAGDPTVDPPPSQANTPARHPGP